MQKKEICRLIQTTLTAKYLPNFLLALFLALAFILAGNIIGQVAYTLSRSGIYKLSFSIVCLDSIANMVYLTTLFGGVLLLVFLWIRLAEKHKFMTIGFYSGYAVGQYFGGFMLGALLFSLIMFILFISGQAQLAPTSGSYLNKGNLVGATIVLLGWSVQSGREEVVTRGWLMNVLAARYNLPLCLLVSSGIFAIIHVLNPNVNLIAILNIVLLGFFGGTSMMGDGIFKPALPSLPAENLTWKRA
ncbi:MAG: CPBP family intramembrane glutamic endopeptidase [Candidatus Pelethousia sp.]|nr:CPBP family intramembrane glutamic endopeptidase [Candidatus Pelethousia sp.]